MKTYTDLEQSKKLAEILPLKSADGFYAENVIITEPYITYLNGERNIPGYKSAIPCWSLSALLKEIPKDIEGSRLRIDIDNVDFSIWYDDLRGYGVNDKLPDTESKEPVDACVAMIEKLHELNLL
jgi:hypothetical protein